MCFAPQRRALFRHLNLQKVARTCGVLYMLTSKCASRHNGVHFFDIWTSKSGANMWCFAHFDLLRATAACTFSTSQLPKVVRTWCVLYILTSKCASRHNGVHFSNISTSKSGPRMVCFVHFWLQNVLRATTACTFSTSQLPKVVREWCALYILTSKCASRHNGVHFFDIATSKSGPRMVCFVHFDFKMCFAPQQRALFRHRNFQNWSEPLVFLTFWLPNVLRATTACNFSSLSWLRTRRFSEPTFRPSGATNHWKKHSVSRLSYLFAHLHLLSSDLSLLSASSLLCFSSVHIVGSLTSKLPSINISIKSLKKTIKS